MGDLEKVLDRFMNELDLMKSLYKDFATVRFTEMDLKEIIYLLGELKAIREKSDGRTT